MKITGDGTPLPHPNTKYIDPGGSRIKVGVVKGVNGR